MPLILLNSLLTRADIPTLERLIGLDAVRLLHAMDESLITKARLREVLLNLRPAYSLVQDDAAWAELVDLLKESEASSLCEDLELNQVGRPWETLKGASRSRASKTLRTICALLSVEPPEPPPEQHVPAVEKVAIKYGLFPHQRSAVTDIQIALGAEPRRVVLHMPTGSGKTRTAMNIVAQHLVTHEPTVVIWLAYSEELCGQAFDEFARAWEVLGNRPITAARFWGGFESDIVSMRDGLIVAGLAKAYSRTLKSTQFIAGLGDATSLVIMDEAHQAIAPSYSLVLDILQSKRNDTAMLGLTATPGRSWDDLDADRELASFFGNKKVSMRAEGYSNPLEYLFEDGYLARPQFRTLLNDSGVDLTESDVSALQQELEIPGRILKRLGGDAQRSLKITAEVEKLSGSHARILLFAPTVENAYLVATVLESHGRVCARAVSGETPTELREETIRWYLDDANESRVLCNYGVLTTGFDAPRTSSVVIARPTKSLVLYSQMVGRAIRGPRAGGNAEAEVVTVVDTGLPSFGDLGESFLHWEDAGWE